MNNLNNDIRQIAKEKGIKLWQIADKYGCTDGNFSRKLRKQFSEHNRARIFGIIEELSRGAR